MCLCLRQIDKPHMKSEHDYIIINLFDHLFMLWLEYSNSSSCDPHASSLGSIQQKNGQIFL